MATVLRHPLAAQGCRPDTKGRAAVAWEGPSGLGLWRVREYIYVIHDP